MLRGRWGGGRVLGLAIGGRARGSADLPPR